MHKEYWSVIKKEFINPHSLPIVKISYFLCNFLRLITFTGVIRLLLLVTNFYKESSFRSFVSVKSLLLFPILIISNMVFKPDSEYFFWFNCYILWDVFIINVWIFLFQQSGKSLSEKDDDIRLIILLFFQFLAVVTAFAGIFLFLFYSETDCLSTDALDFPSAFYYSLVTFTTLGYGEIYPVTNLGRLFIIFELIFGMIFMLLFFSVVLNNLHFKWDEQIKAEPKKASKK